MIGLIYLLSSSALSAESEEQYQIGTDHTTSNHTCYGSCQQDNSWNRQTCLSGWALDEGTFALMHGICTPPLYLDATCTTDNYGCSYALNDFYCDYVCTANGFTWVHYSSNDMFLTDTFHWHPY